MGLLDEIKLHQNVFFAGLLLGLLVMIYYGCDELSEGFSFGFLGGDDDEDDSDYEDDDSDYEDDDSDYEDDEDDDMTEGYRRKRRRKKRVSWWKRVQRAMKRLAKPKSKKKKAVKAVKKVTAEKKKAGKVVKKAIKAEKKAKKAVKKVQKAEKKAVKAVKKVKPKKKVKYQKRTVNIGNKGSFVAINTDGEAHFYDDDGKFVNIYEYTDYNSNDKLPSTISKHGDTYKITTKDGSSFKINRNEVWWGKKV